MCSFVLYCIVLYIVDMLSLIVCRVVRNQSQRIETKMRLKWNNNTNELNVYIVYENK